MINSLTYHSDVARSGTENGVVPGHLWKKCYEVPLTAHPPHTPGSAVRGAPLTLGGWQFQSGPHSGETHDLIFVAASDNYVYAYADRSNCNGQPTLMWSQLLGPALYKDGSNIPKPVGIASTPVLDPDNGRLFVVTLQDDGAGNGVFYVSALDLDTGTIIQNAQLQDAGATGRPTFDGNLQDQRGGLNLVNGRLYATFADFMAYDLGAYHGWVVSFNANNLLNQWYLPLTKTVTGGGAWGPGGAVAAPDGTLYAATAPSADNAYWAALGTGTPPGNIGDYFEGVVRIQVIGNSYSGHLQISDWYQPTWSKALNDADQDFGSSSPLVLPTIGGRDMLVVSAKDGRVYLLDRLNLGHWGGELWSSIIYGAEAKCAPAYFHSATGDHYVYIVGTGLPGLIAFKVIGTSLVEAWRAGGTGIALGDAPGSPVVGVAPGGSSALVWVADAGDGVTPVLMAFDALTGTQVYSSASLASDSLGATPHFPPITCSGEHVFVGTSHGFTCYRNPGRKWIKELKPELKENLKLELKEIKENLKAEIDVIKIVPEVPKLKDNEGDPWATLGGDPAELIRLLAARIDDLEGRLASGQAFIRSNERPVVGEEPIKRLDDSGAAE